MATALPVEEYYRTPGGGTAVRRVQDDLIRVDNGARGGTVFDAERRFAWEYEGPSDVLERVNSEQAAWDHWADDELQAYAQIEPLRPESRGHKWWDYPIYAAPGIMRTILETPELQSLRGLRILEIGGSVKDAWRFVWHGDAARVDEIDVSGNTQRFGLKKLEARYKFAPELLDRFVFHTAAAEALPFAEGSFDLVFSRATIHHTSRPRVFDEIKRVLKRNGIFWMLEPRLSAPVYALMKLGRKLRRVDRGTDDPLRNFELRRLGEMLTIERLYGVGLIRPYAKFMSGNSRFRDGAARLDRALVAGPIGRHLAHTISLVARKP
jgi:SAM-dependent methyltransferase